MENCSIYSEIRWSNYSLDIVRGRAKGSLDNLNIRLWREQATTGPQLLKIPDINQSHPAGHIWLLVFASERLTSMYLENPAPNRSCTDTSNK